MSEESYLLDKKEKSWLSRLLKITFILTACFLIGIAILANMGGSNDSLRESVESFMSELFLGRPVKVEKLVYMSFFPEVGFSAEGISIQTKPEDGYAIAELGKIQVFMGFWNVATRTPRFARFYLENFNAIKGALGPKEIFVEKIFVDHDTENGTAKLRGNGKIGVHPWSFVLDIGVKKEMNIFGSKEKYSYMILREFPLIFDIADIHFDGTFINHKSDYFKFQDFKLSSGNKVLNGDLVISALGKKLLKLKGNVMTSENQTIFSPDVVFDYEQNPVKVSGSILSEVLLFSDLLGDNSVFSIFLRLRDIMGYGRSHASSENILSFFGKYNFDVNFDLRNVKITDSYTENLKFPVSQMNDNIKFGPVQGNTMLMPPLLFVIKKDAGEIISILQDGALNLSLLKGWMKYLPKELKSRENLDVGCGVAVFKHDDKDFLIEDFGIKTEEGFIKVKDDKIALGEGISSVKFYITSEKAELKAVELEKKSYDFVQASLQNSSETSPCSSYVFQESKDEEKSQGQGAGAQEK